MNNLAVSLRFPVASQKAGVGLCKRAYASMQRSAGEVLTGKLSGLIGALVSNPPLAFPALFSMASIQFPLVFGFCNFKGIISENLASVIAGMTRHQEQLMKEFDAQIEKIKGTITRFIGKMIEDLTKEMGLKAHKFNLDPHEISHAFEDWVREADLTKLDDPAQKRKLKELLAEHIDIQPEEEGYLGVLDRSLGTEGFNQISREMAELKKKVDARTRELEAEADRGRSGAAADDDDNLGVVNGAGVKNGAKMKNG